MSFMNSYKRMSDPEKRDPGEVKKGDERLRFKKKRSTSVSYKTYRLIKIMTMSLVTILLGVVIAYLAYIGIVIFVN